GLFNGSATAEPKLTWLNGKPAAPEPPAPRPPTSAPGPVGLFDPVALAERYFAMMQALLDLQRDFGLRLAHQVAELPRLNRLRR
ncbi:MAG TPA: hypothetical protein VIC62_13300, partial [Nakamurella sp.]